MTSLPHPLDRVPSDNVSLVRLLLQAARLVDRSAVELAREEAARSLRPAHARLIPYIGPDGTRLSDLAQCVGISKQAVGQLVDELEALGVVARVADPADGRARRVVFRTGVTSLPSLAPLQLIDDGLDEVLGEARMARIRQDLTEIVTALGA
jgi:hypothetical protein